MCKTIEKEDYPERYRTLYVKGYVKGYAIAKERNYSELLAKNYAEGYAEGYVEGYLIEMVIAKMRQNTCSAEDAMDLIDVPETYREAILKHILQ